MQEEERGVGGTPTADCWRGRPHRADHQRPTHPRPPLSMLTRARPHGCIHPYQRPQGGWYGGKCHCHHQHHQRLRRHRQPKWRGTLEWTSLPTPSLPCCPPTSRRPSTASSSVKYTSTCHPRTHTHTKNTQSTHAVWDLHGEAAGASRWGAVRQLAIQTGSCGHTTRGQLADTTALRAPAPTRHPRTSYTSGAVSASVVVGGAVVVLSPSAAATRATTAATSAQRSMEHVAGAAPYQVWYGCDFALQATRREAASLARCAVVESVGDPCVSSL